jgi:hypothetical protein
LLFQRLKIKVAVRTFDIRHPPPDGAFGGSGSGDPNGLCGCLNRDPGLTFYVHPERKGKIPERDQTDGKQVGLAAVVERGVGLHANLLLQGLQDWRNRFIYDFIFGKNAFFPAKGVRKKA